MATTIATKFSGLPTHTDKTYKAQWARYVARKTLEEDLAAARARVQGALPTGPGQPQVGNDATVSEILQTTERITGLGFVPPDKDHPGKFRVGIIGAGVAGLFTAMVFDWLNETVPGIEIDYDILEAAAEDRLGGRLYTHEFSEKEHDYYDVGAMRFPNNKIMERTFRLFHSLGLKAEKGGLIPYYFPPENDQVCPSYFNDVVCIGNVWKTKGVEDPYKINSGLPEGGKIPEHLLQVDPASLVAKALEDFTKDTAKKFDDARDEREDQSKSTDTQTTALWEHLMAADKMSVRQFLSSTDNGPNMTRGPGYNFNTIEWLETVTFGTGWYDQALTECVLEELDFATPEQKPDEPPQNFWYCIDGGAQRVARLMAKKIKKPVQLHNKVLAIDAHVAEREKKPKQYVEMTLKVEKTDLANNTTDVRSEDYFTIFNSTTLPALQRMDLTNAGLLWGTKQAIRALGYGASCKVAIKFSKPWWQLEPFNINKGGVSRTDLPLRVCVYPSYNIPEAETHYNPDGSAVLLCSYTWGQDAQRLGSLISPNTPQHEKELRDLLLRDLALLHQRAEYPYEKLLRDITDAYVTHHAWDWYRDQNMSGAFAYFGPGQFSNMWEEIIKPNAFGQLYLIGEAASSHHAWIVGALESVIRAVYVLFEGLNSFAPEAKEILEVLRVLKQPQHDVDPEHPERLPTGLPFYPLPEEMPKRQLHTEPGSKTTNDPTSEDTPLNYPAAIASLSLIESYFELLLTKSAPVPGLPLQQQPA